MSDYPKDKMHVKWSWEINYDKKHHHWSILINRFTGKNIKRFFLTGHFWHWKNFWAFSTMSIDFGPSLLISNLIIHGSFIGTSYCLSINVWELISFVVSALYLAELWFMMFIGHKWFWSVFCKWFWFFFFINDLESNTSNKHHCAISWIILTFCMEK